MTGRNGKRAVIINNIHSDSIEQAIFILKPDRPRESSCVGSGIIAEAQEIINNYIIAVEGGTKPAERKLFKPLLCAACFLAAVVFAYIFLIL